MADRLPIVVVAGALKELPSGDKAINCSATLDAVTAAAADATIASGNWAISWDWRLTSATKTAFSIGESAASTGGAGSQILFNVETLSASTADPFRVATRGTDTIRVSRTGDITLTGGSGSAVTVNSSGTIAINATASTISVNSFGALTLQTADKTGANAGQAVTIKSGSTVSSTSGALYISTGTCSGTTSGAISISTGQSSGVSGDISISVGNPTGASRAGIVTLQGGTSRAAQSGNSGGVVVNGGNAGAVASIAGGPVVLKAGNGSATTTGGVGGAVSITAGTGGLAAAGGAVTITAGAGGATAGSAGGKVSIVAGAGTSGTGGDIELTTGASTTNGRINITNSNVANGTVACVFTTSAGPTGAGTAIAGWLAIKIAGTARYIPFW